MRPPKADLEAMWDKNRAYQNKTPAPTIQHPVWLSGELLLEWGLLSEESREKVKKWYDLAVERLQLILDEGREPTAKLRELVIRKDEAEMMLQIFENWPTTA